MGTKGREFMSNTQINYALLTAAVEQIPPDTLTPARLAALTRFAARGLPDVHHEDWKYTNLALVADLSNAWLASEANTHHIAAEPDTLETHLQEEVDAYWITLANGRIRPDQTLARLQTIGVEIALLTDGEDSNACNADDALSHLNLALLRDGLHITVTANNSLDKPLGLFFADAAAPGDVVQERVLIDIEDDASLQLLECHLSNSTDPGFTNTVLQLKLGKSSKVDHVRLQNTGQQHMLVSRTHATLAAKCDYSYASYDFGGRLIRSDFVADIVGDDANIDMHGLYLASDDQHVDNHTRVNHRVGPASSNEEYRGILSGNSRCVFNGKAVIYAGADGTDARQSNHNLLLSEKAEIDTKPELEIYADDVKCSHGATVGQLDEASLFYLQSRGIRKEDATQMLTRAFAAGIVDKAPVNACREFLAGMLDHKLKQMAINQ